MQLVDTVLQDLRYAVRLFRKHPGFTAAAVGSLALGIGANTAIFSLIYALLLRPLPAPAPGQLATFTVRQNGLMLAPDFSYPAYLELRNAGDAYEGVAATGGAPRLRLRIDGADRDGAVQPVRGEAVSSNYFSVLAVPLMLGRGLTVCCGDGQEPAEVVVRERLWARLFNRDPSVLGRTLRLNDIPFTVVGVAPEAFFGFEVGGDPDLWWPVERYAQVIPNVSGRNVLTLATNEWLRVFGRVRTGRTWEVAQAQADAVLKRLMRERIEIAPELKADVAEALRSRTLVLESGRGGWSTVGRQFSRTLAVLMTIVAVVLLIACANIANLLLTRAAARRHELAVRRALGAGRRRLLRQLLTESLLLALTGGAIGLLLSNWLVRALLSYLPEPEMVVDASLDLRILGFLFAVAVVSGLLFGTAPAVRGSRADLTESFQAARIVGGSSRRRWSARDGLIVSQVALSFLLFPAAALFVQTLVNLRSLELGFAEDDVTVFSVDVPAGHDAARHDAIYRHVIERVEALPGVRAASVWLFGMFGGSNFSTRVEIAGYAPRPGEVAGARAVLAGPRFFAATGVPIVRGQGFGAVQNGQAVAIVNQTMAERFFGGDPIGRRFSVNGWSEFEVVGVAADSKYRNLREAPAPTYYAPFFHLPRHPSLTSGVRFGVKFAVRTTGASAASIASSIERVTRDIDPALQTTEVQTMAAVVDGVLSQERLVATLATGLSVLALILSAIGLYGVLSYGVAIRTREIGLRLALGAAPYDLFTRVVYGGVLRVALGIGIGVAGAFAALPVVRSLLYGLEPIDISTMIAAAGVLLGIGTFAAWIPARRASRIDPMAALRCE